MKYILFPYKMGSKSAKTLASTLNTKRVYPDGNYVPKRQHVIINWGNSILPEWWRFVNTRNVSILNEPRSVKVASNKLLTFCALQDSLIRIPNYTTAKNTAQLWLENDECKVVCRTLLNSHSGKGIAISKEVDELVDAPLYTEYIKKSYEFRVHVFQGKVIDYVQKKKKAGFEDRNPYVRSTANGWVFCRDDIEHREDVMNIATDAVNALGLDFGAVDVVVGSEDNLPYVLEVNTAIGMEGTTILKYKDAFEKHINAI